MRCLRTLNDAIVTDSDMYSFVKLLLPRNGESIIEDIKRHSCISKENKIKKICEAYLKEGASWRRLYEALKKAEFKTLAREVKSHYLESICK